MVRNREIIEKEYTLEKENGFLKTFNKLQKK